MSTTLSSLELMLVKIQQIEDQPKDAPPALPVRPVSRARLPRARKNLPFNFYKSGCEENCGFSRQRWYSVVRGENSRREHWYRITRLTAIVVIQKHIREWYAYRELKERLAAVVCLQSGIRGWLSRNHFNHIEHEQKLKIENEKDVRNLPKDIDEKDLVLVQHFVLVDLQKQALRMEAKVRKKNNENSSLKMRLQKMERKWQEYEERMKSLEKTWQDQLTYIQTCLAAAKKNPTDEIIIGKFGQCDTTSRHQNQNADGTTSRTGVYHGKSMVNSLDLPSNDESWPHIINNSTNHVIEQFEGVYDDDGDRARVATDQVKLHPGVELRKLKLRFTAWKKDFKIRLWEAERTFKKLGHLETEKGQKRWWERQMKNGI
ncbi:myosin-1-like isoform X2 [Olea europaea subsp. europaea]|uniref:Myosin-1-like isoform X2 n=1 Tax=Olea europaea subsp. europaea TaxID=158383 RepID=A0A8S0TKM6_OLEEU|nr:myosin-1-like isoform X2 [Olea europaea subsp. europaea]